jgi:hypothetical protein
MKAETELISMAVDIEERVTLWTRNKIIRKARKIKKFQKKFHNYFYPLEEKTKEFLEIEWVKSIYGLVLWGRFTRLNYYKHCMGLFYTYLLRTFHFFIEHQIERFFEFTYPFVALYHFIIYIPTIFARSNLLGFGLSKISLYTIRFIYGTLFSAIIYNILVAFMFWWWRDNNFFSQCWVASMHFTQLAMIFKFMYPEFRDELNDDSINKYFLCFFYFFGFLWTLNMWCLWRKLPQWPSNEIVFIITIW